MMLMLMRDVFHHIPRHLLTLMQAYNQRLCRCLESTCRCGVREGEGPAWRFYLFRAYSNIFDTRSCVQDPPRDLDYCMPLLPVWRVKEWCHDETHKRNIWKVRHALLCACRVLTDSPEVEKKLADGPHKEVIDNCIDSTGQALHLDWRRQKNQWLTILDSYFS